MKPDRKISIPSDEEVNAAMAYMDSNNPDELRAEVERMTGLIRLGEFDVLNGAKVIALLRSLASYV